MSHPGFFHREGPFSLRTVVERSESALAERAAASAASIEIADVRGLADAGAGDISFLDNRKYLPQLASTRAAACFVAGPFVERVPAGTAALVSKAPYRSFALALQLFYPEAMTPKSAMSVAGEPAVHPTARIGEGARVELGAVVGREAAIGRDTVIAAGAVVGYRCAIGEGCYVGPCASVTHAIVGDRVLLHAGVRIGQDGFGFAMGPGGHLKVPQIGRVVIGDDVEIGANTSIDRGALKDTVIGAGTKIDNLVQIGHNVVIGRHCVIVAQVGISGSTELGDFVVMGGQSGAVGHIKIGTGAQIGGASHAKDDVPAGARVAGTPARPLREFARGLAVVKRLAAKGADADENG